MMLEAAQYQTRILPLNFSQILSVIAGEYGALCQYLKQVTLACHPWRDAVSDADGRGFESPGVKVCLGRDQGW